MKEGRYIGMYSTATADSPNSGHYLKWDGDMPVWAAAPVVLNGSTTNGVLTYGGSGVADVESSLTYNAAGGTGTLADTNGTGFVLDGSGDIELNAAGGDIVFKIGTAALARFSSDGLSFQDNTGAGIIFEGTTDDAFNTTLSAADTTGSSKSITLPDRTGTVALTDQLGWHGSTTRIKILHSDFIPDDGGRPFMIDDTGVASEELFAESYGSHTSYATVAIPTGYTATHVMVYGSATGAMEVWEHQINSKTGVSKGTGNVDTEIDITDVTSSSTNYLFIRVEQGSGDELHGGYVTITEA